MAILRKDRRILELALKGLEAERDVIVSEIAELRAKLAVRVATGKRKRATKAIRKQVTKNVQQGITSAKKRARKMSAAQRKALSQKMKAAWARRKAAE